MRHGDYESHLKYADLQNSPNRMMSPSLMISQPITQARPKTVNVGCTYKKS